MEILGKISLIIHIIAGFTTLITGPFAIFYNFKDPKKHRFVGKIFFYAMIVVGISTFFGYLKRPESAFFQFLLGIAILVLAGIFRGVRAIFMMKGGAINRFDFGYTYILGASGIWMLGMSAWHFQQGTMIAIPILFMVFGAGSLADTFKSLRIFNNPAVIQRMDWMHLHSASMLGAFTASSTAFTVNAAHFLPWYIQWFGPTLLLLPIQIYFGRKLKRAKTSALVSA